jgi:MFS transporter, DHA1 family, quinolone resistance protein
MHRAEQARKRTAEQGIKISNAAAAQTIDVGDELDLVFHEQMCGGLRTWSPQPIIQSIVIMTQASLASIAGRSETSRSMRLESSAAQRNLLLIRLLTCLMFLMFAMTTDAVGGIVPKVIEEFHLDMKAASAFQYAPMAAIAAGALLLGFLADRLGRKLTIIIGLSLYGVSAALFALGHSFGQFLALLALSGLGISIFKTGALALIGDISTSMAQHTSIMNLAEGSFGIGSIIGPAIVAALLGADLSWKWLYVIAAGICALLVLLALSASYPQRRAQAEPGAGFVETFSLLRDRYALAFSCLISLYVAVEVAIYVWMPTYLRIYRGPLLRFVPYALTTFFVLRAGGRLVGAWLLARLSWSVALGALSFAILGCFAGSLLGGARVGVVLLPLSGLFMSVVYPTLNSKGISGFPKIEHGRIAGLLLFFTALAAALGPFAMGAVSDAYGSAKYGFVLAAIFALMLFLGLLTNALTRPVERRLAKLERAEYAAARERLPVSPVPTPGR